MIIAQETFIHQNINYTFRWARDHQDNVALPKLIDTKLRGYYQKILQRHIPEALFNDPMILRCSRFRIKGLERGAIPKISKDLVRRSIVQEISENNEPAEWQVVRNLSKFANEVYSTYRKNGMNEKPSHDVILHNLIIRHETSLSMETPIWNPVSFQDPVKVHPKQTTLLSLTTTPPREIKILESKFTGHIDLMLYSPENETLIISDYKPEGEYLPSLPQVAFYGMFFKRLFKLDNVMCVSFSKDDAWVYDPEILKTDILDYLEQYGSPKLDWVKIIEKM